MRAASGPGFVLSGRSMPIAWPVTRLEKFQSILDPDPARTREVGDMVPAGKSTASKSVVTVTVRFWTRLTPDSASAYTHLSRPRDTYPTSRDAVPPGGITDLTSTPLLRSLTGGASAPLNRRTNSS